MSTSDVSALLRGPEPEGSAEEQASRVRLRVVGEPGRARPERRSARPATIQIARVPPAERERLRSEVPEARERAYRVPAVRADCEPCRECQAERDRLARLGLRARDEKLACGHAGMEVVAHSRPCLYVGCTMNNYLDVQERTGNLRLAFSGLEPSEMAAEDSCAADVAEEGGATLERVALAANVTRERVRQWEEAILRKLLVPASRVRK